MSAAPSKAKRKKVKPNEGRVVTFPEDSFWLGTAARVLKLSQAEFVREYVRPVVRKVLVENGTDPDKILAANRN